MTATPRLGITELEEGQALPEAGSNEAWRDLEQGAGARSFKSRVTTAPPGSPAESDEYLVPASATGAWTGKDGLIAWRLNGAWKFVTPYNGIVALVQEEGAYIGRIGGSWVGLGLSVNDDTTMAADSHAVPPSQHAVRGYVAAAVASGGVTVDNDTTLAGDSATAVPSQHAVKTAIATAVVGLLDYKGGVDCSTNPNYPAALKGDAYFVTVAGRIGGPSGAQVDVGDFIIAKADNAGGTDGAVGTSWNVLEHNLVGAIVGAGALLAANNLSDVANAASARTNIGAKAIAPVIQSAASAATLTLTFTDDAAKLTAQAAALNVANPTGTAVDMWGWAIKIKDNGTARGITFGSQFRAVGVTLPTTTVVGKTLYLACIWNSDDTKVDVVAVAQEA